MHVASESRPDHWYPICRRPDGRLFCGCPDFVNRRQHTGEECKNLRHPQLEGRLRPISVPPAQTLQTIVAPRFLLLDL